VISNAILPLGRSSWKRNLLGSVFSRALVDVFCPCDICQSGPSRLDYIRPYRDNWCDHYLGPWPRCPLHLSWSVDFHMMPGRSDLVELQHLRTMNRQNRRLNVHGAFRASIRPQMLTGPKLTAFATTDVAPENGLRMSLAEGVELQSNLLRVSHPSIDCVSSCNCGINSEALDTKLACGRNIIRIP